MGVSMWCYVYMRAGSSGSGSIRSPWRWSFTCLWAALCGSGNTTQSLGKKLCAPNPKPPLQPFGFFFYNTHWFTTFLTPHIPELIQSEITLLRSKIYSVVLILLFIYSNINFSKIPFLLFKLLLYYLIVVLNIYFFILHKFCNYII